MRPDYCIWKQTVADLGFPRQSEENEQPYISPKFSKQECIPVGCVPTAAVAVSRGVYLVRGGVPGPGGCTWSSRVPTRTGKTGKPGKMGRHFPVREKSGNFEQTGKVREKSGKTTPNTGKLREFQKKNYLLFFNDI